MFMYVCKQTNDILSTYHSDLAGSTARILLMYIGCYDSMMLGYIVCQLVVEFVRHQNHRLPHTWMAHPFELVYYLKENIRLKKTERKKSFSLKGKDFVFIVCYPCYITFEN